MVKRIVGLMVIGLLVDDDLCNGGWLLFGSNVMVVTCQWLRRSRVKGVNGNGYLISGH